MRRSTADRCRECGLHREIVGVLSWRGLCAACGTAAHIAQLEQMARKSGPLYEAWIAAGGKAGRPRQ